MSILRKRGNCVLHPPTPSFQIRGKIHQMGVGQFGEYLTSQFGEKAKSVNLANFSEGCQNGDAAKSVNLANLLKGLSKW